MAAVLVRPHEKFFAASLPLNSLFMNCVKWSDKLKNVLCCTINMAILTSASIDGSILELAGFLQNASNVGVSKYVCVKLT